MIATKPEMLYDANLLEYHHKTYCTISMFHFDKRKHLKDFHCMNVSRVNIFEGKLLARGSVGGYIQLLGLT